MEGVVFRFFCAKVFSVERKVSRFFLRLVSFSLFFTFSLYAEENQFPDLELPAPNTLNYKIAPGGNRHNQIYSDSNKKFYVERITPVLMEVDTHGKIVETRLEGAQFDGLISTYMAEKQHAFSVNDLTTLANKLSELVRKRGYLLSMGYLPGQEVLNGEVRLNIMIGALGEVSVENNKEYKSSLFTSGFAGLEGKTAIQSEMEGALLLLKKRVAGANIKGTFQKNREKAGFSDLVISVPQEWKFRTVAFADNYGSDFTGAIRAGVHSDVYNLLGLNDNLAVDLVLNEKPDGVSNDGSVCCYGRVDYEYIGENLTTSFGVEYSKSTYDVGNAGNLELSVLRLNGESEKTRLYGTYSLSIDLHLQYWLNYGVSHVRTESKLDSILLNQDDIAEYDIGLDFNYYSDSKNLAANFTAFHRIKPGDDSLLSRVPDFLGYNTDNNPSVVSEDRIPPTRIGSDLASSNRFALDFSFQDTLYHENFRYQIKFKGQYSSDPLAPIQQFGIAGPNSVRALETGAYLADKGLVVSVDFTSVERLGDWTLRPSLFFDYGYGTTNPVEGDNSTQRSAISLGGGVGADLSYLQNLNLRLTVAWEMRDQDVTDVLGSGNGVAGDDPQIYGSAVYIF